MLHPGWSCVRAKFHFGHVRAHPGNNGDSWRSIPVSHHFLSFPTFPILSGPSLYLIFGMANAGKSVNRD